jgi:hypothetical protein
MKRFHANHPKRSSETMLKYWSDPDFRTNQSQKTSARWKSEAFRKKQRQGMKRYWKLRHDNKTKAT